MSGVYVYEVSDRLNLSENILKIGSTRDSLDKRVVDSFNYNFSKDRYSFYMVESIPCSPCLAHQLENYLISWIRDNYSVKPFKGREFFYFNFASAQDLKGFLCEKVLEFFHTNKGYTGIKNSMGSLIRFKRKSLNITQVSLSKKLGVRQATISAMENGKINNISTLCDIADELDISIIACDNSRLDSLVLME